MRKQLLHPVQNGRAISDKCISLNSSVLSNFCKYFFTTCVNFHVFPLWGPPLKISIFIHSYLIQYHLYKFRFTRASRVLTPTSKLYHTFPKKAIPFPRNPPSEIPVIINRNPVLKLCKRENRHEQTVNFSENHEHFLKNVGSKVEGYFHGRSGGAEI